VKRWTTVLGRGGTVLIAISLALLLVSFIPQIRTSRSEGSGPLSPGGINIMLHQAYFNPQQEIEVAVTVEGTVTVYLLEITLDFRISPDAFGYSFNSTDLQEVLEEHPDKVIWEHEVENGDYKRGYSPTRVMNATVIVYNQPDSEIAYFEYEVSVQSGLAPKDKVRTIAYWAAPIGVILMIPWLLNVWKQRKNKLV
jgi:hypothetical protein